MIYYSNEGFGPFAASLLFKYNGSVIPKAAVCATPFVGLAVVLCYQSPEDLENRFGAASIGSSLLWSAAVSVCSALLVFRTNKAYARFWDGTSLLHQMWGEWFDAVSNLVAFSMPARKLQSRGVDDFRHTLIRLMSLCHASALEEISNLDEGEEGFPRLDIGGLDQSTLVYLDNCKSDPECGFNRVEVILHMIQTMVIDAHAKGILAVPPPILSRVFQTLSRGQVNLTNCKKMTSTLFPFPYAQLSAWLIVAVSLLTPFFMATVCKNMFWAGTFTYLTLFGMFCLNYIARELEMPFGSDANDLPLHDFQDHMNSSLLMLIRHESDLIPHRGSGCNKTFSGIRDNISTQEPSHFIQAAKLRTCITLDDVALSRRSHINVEDDRSEGGSEDDAPEMPEFLDTAKATEIGRKEEKLPETSNSLGAQDLATSQDGPVLRVSSRVMASPLEAPTGDPERPSSALVVEFKAPTLEALTQVLKDEINHSCERLLEDLLGLSRQVQSSADATKRLSEELRHRLEPEDTSGGAVSPGMQAVDSGSANHKRAAEKWGSEVQLRV
eukprot:TRINITY_DN109696_c0_g1_i1.p1 TRINITY_DN109696_c0_g1~~TRINITY_DN109696_c0_g1_i1.p1  ORF type:complete len:554 (+),score=90.49 TRINITY_DN109696_c0_g1_i1:48-1709(+)